MQGSAGALRTPLPSTSCCASSLHRVLPRDGIAPPLLRVGVAGLTRGRLRAGYVLRNYTSAICMEIFPFTSNNLLINEFGNFSSQLLFGLFRGAHLVMYTLYRLLAFSNILFLFGRSIYVDGTFFEGREATVR